MKVLLRMRAAFVTENCEFVQKVITAAVGNAQFSLTSSATVLGECQP